MQPMTTTPIQPHRNRPLLRWIIVILILVTAAAVVTFFVIRHTEQTNREDAVKSELIKQNKIIKTSAVNNIYKQTLPQGVNSTDKVIIDAKVATSGTSYCIAALSKQDSKIGYYMNEITPEDAPIKGNCTNENSIIDPSVPGGSVITSTGTNDVSLQWSASLYAAGYIVQCATNDSFTTDQHSKDTTNISEKIDTLVGNTLYYCRVAATNQHGQSQWTPTLQARTSLYSQPPKNIKANIVSSTELSYSWDAVPGAQYYILQYTTDIDFATNVTTVRVDKTSGSIQGLQPYTGYFFRSEAVTDSFDQTHAAFSDAAFARTKK